MADKQYYIDIDGLKIPVRIIIERRLSTRVALGGTHVILRIPKAIIFNTNINKHVEWATSWLKELKSKKPTVFEKYTLKKEFFNQQEFHIGGKVFTLQITESSRESGTIKLIKDNILAINIPLSQDYDKQKLIRDLLIKFCQNYFLPEIIKKVNHYNHLYFQKQIKSVRLKYNKSNWGSCSTGKNLNFSIRLFFAPDDVINYVVVHELAHLVEMNHSDRFWNIVESIIPDYLEKEKILKLNNGKFDF